VLREEGVETLPGPRLDFYDPSGNRVQVVQYDQIQFQKAPEVLAAMGLEALSSGAGRPTP
jgi:lactoylglutathione lyase